MPKTRCCHSKGVVGDAWRRQTRIVCNRVGIPVLTGGVSLNRVVLGMKCCKNSPNVSCVAVSVCSDLGTSGGGVEVIRPNLASNAVVKLQGKVRCGAMPAMAISCFGPRINPRGKINQQGGGGRCKKKVQCMTPVFLSRAQAV